ncbi:uncharacterized protein LOC121375088 [Gigantopelta aegis]|uniref:uncharacterized protein LOC121375088 n=1 Tax=Gigantopelta aegis TaxID=1735272 RepID=UPI001B88A198|nr:uncharacterized protein LOC121375088 [Gigantopelta aegis]
MAFTSLIFILCVLKTSYIAAASTNVGREYIIVFMEHIVNSSQLTVYITTRHQTAVEVQLSAPLAPSSQYPLNITVTNSVVSRVTLNKDLALKFTGRFDNGVLISSDGDITVQCFSSSISAKYPYSIGGYLALPTNVLGTEYMIATFRERNSCLFAVVGIADDTLVVISFKLPPMKQVMFEDKTYRNGDTVNITINRYEAVHMSSLGSLTGTFIRATAKVAVFVGADYTSANGLSMDHMVEQLPPLDSWGMDYMLIPFPDRSSFDLVVVVAQFERTTVVYDNAKYVIDGAGENITLKLMSDTPTRLWSDKRIEVMQVSTSFNTYAVYTDPAMLLIPPVEQWVSTYLFASPNIERRAKPVVLALAADSNCTRLFKLMAGATQVSLTWTKIAGTKSSVSYTTLAREGPYTVDSLNDPSTCSAFGGYLYGPGFHSAWAMPIGQSVKSLPDKRDEVVSSSAELGESSSLQIMSSSPQIEASTRFESPSLESSSDESSSPVIRPSSTYLSLTTTYEESSVNAEISEHSICSSNDALEVSLTTSTSMEKSSSLQPSTTSISSTRPPLCTCSCKVTRTVTDVSSKIVEMQKNLTVEKKNLSSTRRKQQSAVDPRSSSLTIGLFGIAFVSLTLMLVTVPDIIQGISYLLSAFHAEHSFERSKK